MQEGRVTDSGRLAARMLREAGVEVSEPVGVPDDVRTIAEAVQTAAYGEVDFVITTGGTGVGPQDYTARAMDPLLRFDIPGISEAIRLRGIQNGHAHGMLSRGRAGVMVFGRTRTLVVNVSDSEEAVRDAMDVLLPILTEAVQRVRGE